jgi:beta-lactamase class D
VKEAKYGNQKIGPQSDLDKFWLEGELRISPQEQIQFLRRLHGNELPFTARSVSLVKDLMIMEQTPDYTIRAKTGFVGQIGWVVGYVEKGKDVYFFATNIDIKNPKDLPTRMALTRRCLKDIGVL